MIYKDIELHNALELLPTIGGGVHMIRIPEAVRSTLSPLGRMVAQESAGCEIRFVTQAKSFRVALSVLPSTLFPYEIHNLNIQIFKGAFFHSTVQLEAGKINHINITDIIESTHNSFQMLKPEVRDTDYFDHTVWRIMLGRYPTVFHEIDTYGYPIRPPKPEEVPSKKILFYGSSITNGASPTSYHLCYVQQAARYLKVDPLNQGLSGSCRMEKEMADYLANREDWDEICLELGVNVRLDYSPEEFKKRSRYLIEQLIAKHSEKPVYLITIYPNGQSPANALEVCDIQCNQEAFSQVLRNLLAELQHPHLHLIEGADILTDYTGITTDLIHPGDYGHSEMGMNLAHIINTIRK